MPAVCKYTHTKRTSGSEDQHWLVWNYVQSCILHPTSMYQYTGTHAYYTHSQKYWHVLNLAQSDIVNTDRFNLVVCSGKLQCSIHNKCIHTVIWQIIPHHNFWLLCTMTFVLNNKSGPISINLLLLLLHFQVLMYMQAKLRGGTTCMYRKLSHVTKFC